MPYMLDTDICVFLIKKKTAHLIKKLERQDVSSVFISSITLSELEYGVEKNILRDQAKAALDDFLTPLTVLPYTKDTTPFYGKIRAYLEKRGQTIGPLDMLIGAHALSMKATVVTNNDREFKRIPGLKVENWCF